MSENPEIAGLPDLSDNLEDVVLITIKNSNSPTPPSNAGSSLLRSSDPYALLVEYSKEAKIMTLAHAYTAQFYNDLAKYLSFPLILLSTSSSVCAGLNVNQYILLGMTLSMLVLTSFDHAINPKSKQHNHMLAKVEFDEIAGNLRQFIGSNHRTPAEIKEYSEEILTYLQKWKSIAPTVPPRYMRAAMRDREHRVRKHKKLKASFAIAE
jgi:hypothetical protein